MRQSFRLAIRMLLTNTWFTAAAVTTLALGIGAATAMVSVTYGVLLRPLPYPEPERIVLLTERHAHQPHVNIDWSFSNITYHAWNRQRLAVGPLGFAGASPRTVGSDAPSRMLGGDVSPSMFGILRVEPLLGRFFVEDDTRAGAIPVVVLSEGLWREHFGGDAGALGQRIAIDRLPHEIVGVAPRGFSFPERDVRFWTTSGVTPPIDQQGRLEPIGLTAYARLARGATPQQAAEEGTAIARVQAWPGGRDPFWGEGPPTAVAVTPIATQMADAVRPVILFLLAGAAGLLVIACANVANLLLSRGSARGREIGVMAALGATRAMLMTQLLIEGLLIAAIGGAIGVIFAIAIVRALPALAPADFPRLADIRIDWTIAAAAALISLAAGVAAGVMPALRGGRSDLISALRTTSASASRRTTTSRRTLLIAETALAMTLVALATLVGRGFVRLMSVDPGYTAEHVLSAEIFLPNVAPRSREPDQFASALLEQLRAMPKVRAAGAGWMAPFGGTTAAHTVTFGAPGRETVSAASLVNVVTPGYAEALGLQLTAGRLLTNEDLSLATLAVVVNEEFVRTFLRDRNPIDLNLGAILSRVDATVVGVVRNVLRDGRQTKPQPEIYLVAAQRYSLGGQMKVVVRTEGDPGALAGTVRDLVRRLRKDAALDKVVPLATELSDSVRTERLATTTMGSFALVATMLAAIGLYGVLSYNVATRWREIGIRAALGADARDIVWLVVRDGLAVTSIGLVLGLAAAAGSGRLLQSAIFGVEPLDPAAFMLAPAVLLTVALIACLIPARRATRIDPALALRAE